MHENYLSNIRNKIKEKTLSKNLVKNDTNDLFLNNNSCVYHFLINREFHTAIYLINFLEIEVDLINSEHWLIFASQDQNVFNLIIEKFYLKSSGKKINLNIKDSFNHNLLMLCVQNDNTEGFIKLLEIHDKNNIFNFNHINDTGNSLLFFCISKMQSIYLSLLMKYQLDINILNKSKINPIVLAMYLNNKEAVNFILNKGLDVKKLINNYYSILMFSIINSEEIISEMIINKNSSIVNILDLNKRNSLFYAIEENKENLFHLLIKKGADITQKDINNVSVIDFLHLYNKEHWLQEEYQKYINENQEPTFKDYIQANKIFNFFLNIISNRKS